MSVAGDIADAVVAAVQALGLVRADDETLDSASVYRLKVPALLSGKNPPVVVVSVGEEGETEPVTDEQDVVRYPVAVTVVTGGGSTQADDETVRTWRQQIRRKLHDPATYAAVATFETVDTAGKSPFDPAALAKDLNYSVLTATVQSLESRT